MREGNRKEKYFYIRTYSWGKKLEIGSDVEPNNKSSALMILVF